MDHVVDYAAQWDLLVGFLLPPVLAVVIQSKWNSRVKSMVLLVAAGVIGMATAYWHGGLNASNWLGSALVILVSAAATYKGFWKTVGVQRIENSTNLSAKTPA